MDLVQELETIVAVQGEYNLVIITLLVPLVILCLDLDVAGVPIVVFLNFLVAVIPGESLQ